MWMSLAADFERPSKQVDRGGRSFLMDRLNVFATGDLSERVLERLDLN